MIETYIDRVEEKHILFDAINKIPCIAKKANWALKWTNNHSTDANSSTTINSFNLIEKMENMFGMIRYF